MKPAERYIVEHETRYAYTAPVSQSWQLARLTPRTLPWQNLVAFSLAIEPRPDECRDELDSFGNTVTHFGLHGGHRLLRVRMACVVEVSERPTAHRSATPLVSDEPAAGRQTEVRGEDDQSGRARDAGPLAAIGMSWEAVRDTVRRHPESSENLQAARMSEPTQLLPLSDGARMYASKSFRAGRDWFEAVEELMRRIYLDFEFEPGATTVSTSVEEVLEQRSGVCQDFAHLMLASLRGLGLPARYVSGYLLTEPPPGQPRLMGADASHAWVAAFSPEHGWVEFDPTNNQLADARYITLSWGADFADVVPLRGVILGGGDQQMTVEVSVIPQ
jgi:transglutaminase-like putative cysteine protease